jgi:tetratricopeptide (TPR) repeat protein
VTRALVVLALVATPALAEPRSKQAKADVLFEQGQAHYTAGEYQAAIPLFKEAYELVHDPVYLFNVAQSYRKVADCLNAFDYYNQYLAQDPTSQQRDKVTAWLRELQPCVEQRQKEQQDARDAEALRRDAERRRIEAAKPRFADVDRGAPYRIAGIATASAGVVGLAVGVVFTIRGSNLQSELQTTCAKGCNWNDYLDKDEAGKRANVYAAIGWIGGGVAVLGGVGLYMLGRNRFERVQITPVNGGATVGASASF